MSKKEYVCSHCDYSTFKNSEYQKHIKTKKHLRKNGLLVVPDNLYVCECGNSYKTRSGFYKHQLICSAVPAIQAESVEPSQPTVSVSSVPQHNTSTMQFDQSNMSIDQYLKMRELDLKEQEMQIQAELEKEKIRMSSQIEKEKIRMSNQMEEKRMDREDRRDNVIISAIEKVGSAVTNNQTHTNSHNTVNNNFNLQLYLNDTCKDAMNIMDFVQSLKYSAEDIERVGRIGYAEAISKLMIEGLQSMDATKRPIHCTDAKREKMYIKDQDEWTKDDSNAKLKRAIKAIGHNNLGALEEWKEKHPRHDDPPSGDHEKYLDICSKSMEGLMDEDNKEYKKIVKKIAPETTINKEEAIQALNIDGENNEDK